MNKYACNDITKTVRLQGFIDKSGKLVNWTPDRGCPTHLELLEKDLEHQRFTPATVNGRYVKSVAFVDYVFTDNPNSSTSRESTTTGSATARTLPRTRTNQTGIEFVLIPAGSFMMGSTYGGTDEKPVHQVTISQPFYMGKYEVTQSQWQSVMGSNPSYFKDCGGNCPVEQISWNDAQDFVNKLNEANDGFKYRLPSEAEWEYACRAGTTGDYYAADVDDIGWHNGNSGKKTRTVGGKQPNAFGLYDMSGNVWEWCRDWYHPNYDGAPTDGTAWLSGGEMKYRVLRGGSWDGDASLLRSAYRGRNTPDYRNSYFGFRVVAVAQIQVRQTQVCRRLPCRRTRLCRCTVSIS